MLHRVKKEHDVNQDKWIGVGGKFEGNESPDECLLREVREETGLTLTDFRFRGVVTFLTDGGWEGEYMYLFTATGWTGELAGDCAEGDLEWVPKEQVADPAHLGGGQDLPASAGGGASPLPADAGVRGRRPGAGGAGWPRGPDPVKQMDIL